MDRANQRNVALRRLSRISRWVAASAVVASGVFTAMVAWANPGHRAVTTNSTSPSGATTDQAPPPTDPPVTAADPAANDPAALIPLQPAPAPLPTRQAPVAASGAS